MGTLLTGVEPQQRVVSNLDSGVNARWAGGNNAAAATEEANGLLMQAYTLSLANFCR